MRRIGSRLAAMAIGGCVLMAVAGCAGSGGAGGGGAAQLVGTRWLAQTIGGREASLAPASSVGFEAAQVNGKAGCNTFNGTIGYAGDQMSVGPLATTRRMCSPEIMAQETAFLQALQTAQRFAMTEWLLTLYDPSGNPSMTLTRMTEPM